MVENINESVVPVAQDISVEPDKISEMELVSTVLKYLDVSMNPVRSLFVDRINENNKFAELNQYDEDDKRRLNELDVPAIPIDRTDRAISTLVGIRDASNHQKKITKMERGDVRVAEILDSACTFTSKLADFEYSRNKAFVKMLIEGSGVRKIGYDPFGLNNEGMIWCDVVRNEDLYISKYDKENLEDATWIAHVQRMDWEQAAQINPLKSEELKLLRTTMALNDKSTGSSGADYSAKQSQEPVYPDYVEIIELWRKEQIPKKVIERVFDLRIEQTPLGVRTKPMTIKLDVDLETPITRLDKELGIVLRPQWRQIIIARGKGNGGILLSNLVSKYMHHPFVGMCAQLTKAGIPIAFMEYLKPHQRRLNLAYVQKLSWNFTRLKTPLIADEDAFSDKTVPNHISSVVKVIYLKPNKKIHDYNPQASVDLQSIEEENSAKADLDFSAASTEAPLRGLAQAGSSGIQVAQLQSAAVTPLNKQIKADVMSETLFWKKVLEIIIKEYDSDRYRRIVGDERFIELVVGKTDPLTGEPLEQILELPLSIDVANYDVVIEERSSIEVKKLQNANAVISLMAAGILFDDEFVIRNSNLENTEDAIASNRKAKQDFLKQLILAQNQTANAQRGKSEPQNGKRKMIGGESPNTIIN